MSKLVKRKITYNKSFLKAYEKITRSNLKIKTKIKEKIRLFSENPSSPILKDHALVGDMDSLRSFSITGDVRIIYSYNVKENTVIFLDIGTHNQVY